MDDATRIEQLLGERPLTLSPVSGGDIARSLQARFADGRRVMLKFRRPGQFSLRLEARMLQDLSHAGLPVPAVLAADDNALAMAWIEQGGGRLSLRAQRAAGRALAQLHAQPQGDDFGYAYDTAIGRLRQPNPACRRWRDFFREQRLLYRAASAAAAGQLPAALHHRLERLASRLDTWLPADSSPSLVHGDLWGGNLLERDTGEVIFIDPALYLGDGEVDLAFACLFRSVDEAFFQGYAEVRRLQPGFFAARRDLYNIYPLLVHVELFGKSYLTLLDETLKRLGG